MVASDLPVFADFLQGGFNALLCPVGESDALARSILAAAGDERLRRAGLATAAEHSWDAAAAAHEAVYASLPLERSAV